MTSFLTKNGLTIKRQNQIKSEILDNIRLKFEEIEDEIDTEDSLIGNLVDVFSSQIADVWLAVQQVYDGQILDSAEGKNLDDIALHLSAERLEADCTKTIGALKGNIGTKIERNFLLQCIANNENFYLVDNVVLGKNNCIEFTAKINNSVSKNIYTIIVDGYEISYTAKENDKTVDICTALVTKFKKENFSITQNNDTYTIKSLNFNTFDPYVDQSQLILNVTNKALFHAVNNGTIYCPLGTLTKILSPVNGLIESYNFEQPKNLGRLLENDIAYRMRIKKSGALRGQNTLDALKAQLKNLRGVSDVDIIENRSHIYFKDDTPPKAFQVIIEGGDENEIAKCIYKHKIAGIEAFGKKIIQVLKQDNHWINIGFTRPIEVQILVKIEVKTFSDYPENGDELIKYSIQNYGNSLGINKSLFDQKFFGSVFNICNGISHIKIQLAKKIDSIYLNEIKIGRTEYSSFNINDIVVIKHV